MVASFGLLSIATSFLKQGGRKQSKSVAKMWGMIHGHDRSAVDLSGGCEI
jgi:hypothetical protein